MGLFFNYPTIWRSFALKTPSKLVIFDQNKVKYLGALEPDRAGGGGEARGAESMDFKDSMARARLE